MQRAYWVGRNPEFELGGVGIHLYEELDCRELDVPRLSAAWQRTIERHDPLRTVVLSDGRQQVLEAARYEIESIPVFTEAELLETRRRLSHRLYAVDAWPSFEILVARLDDGRTRLFLSIDLNFLDLHGLGLVFADWIEWYRHPDAELPAPEIRFRDYVLGLDAVEQADSHRESTRYWREQVEKLPPPPAVPLAKSPALVRPPRFVRRSGRVCREKWAAMKMRAARAGTTPSCLTLAAYAEVLRMWSAGAAFTVNVTLNNSLPLHPGIREVPGMFTAGIPVAMPSLPGAGFEQRSQAAQGALAEVLRNRTAAGVWVLRAYARALGKGPAQAVLPVVFTSTLNVTPHPLTAIESLGDRVFHLIQTPQVSLDLQVYERAGDLIYHWDAVPELFPPGVPGEMAEAFDAALASLEDEAAWGRKRLCELPGPQRERRNAANRTQDVIEPMTVDQLAWCGRAAMDSPAVIASHERLTRGELHAAGSRIAGRLRDRGVGREDLVCVVLEKGCLQYSAVHGVLLSGAAYVPVAPDLPPERFRHLLRNAKSHVALTSAALRERLEWPAGIEALAVDEPGDVRAGPPGVPGRTPRDLAYMLYTSGSSGEPKGVMIEHASVVNRMVDVNRRFGIGEADRVFALTALHHDLSVYDLFGIQAAGGAAVLPDADKLREPAHWAELIRKHRVTIWNSVPAYLDMLATYLEQTGDPTSAIRGLRLVLLAGDWIPVTLPGRLRALAPDARVIALGGPTETTVWDICFPVERTDPAWTSIPYGTPMRNSRYYVLNEHLEDRPDWVSGELFIGGAGLARGYWEDAEKTALCFVNHPESDERLYRSGDLGRFLPDGNIEFLGRADSQLKIRGHRIEAGEVAAAILQHPGVANVLVRAEGDRNRGMRLAAYVVPKSQGYDPVRRKLSEPEQIQFRLRQAGLRTDLRGRAAIPLGSAECNGGTPWKERRSCRSFRREALAFDHFARLIGLLRGQVAAGAPLPRYLYPSAGSLYPVRCYVCVAEGGVQGISRGSYYYHPAEHRLQLVHEQAPEGLAHLRHNRRLVESAGFLFVLSGSRAAIEPVYGELARDFCLLEAGYIGQLLMTGAASLGIGLCPIGDLDRAAVGDLLGLAPDEEILHALAGGVPGEECGVRLAEARDWAREIRETVRTALPEHMVPERIVVVDEFRLSGNGKIDWSALPQPHEAAVEDCRSDPPCTKWAREVSAIVCELLDTECVPPDRGFLELGCNSIQLVELAVRLQKKTGREVSIADLFAHPTVRRLASFLDGRSEDVNVEALRRGALRLQLRSAHVV
jgi:epothilone synthetase B